MADILLDNGLAVLAFARQATLAFLDDLPEDKLCYSPIPDGNHAMWLIGHITVTDDTVRHGLGGGTAKCPEGWTDLFGAGSAPAPDPGKYPSVAEMREHLNARREDLIAWFRSMDHTKLTEALPEDSLRFAPNYAGLMASLAFHEGLHAGQLRVITKSLGRPPKFG